MNLTPFMVRALDVSIEKLVGSEQRKVAGKRGPVSKIQQQLERIHALPKPQQRALMQVIDSVLQQHGVGR